MPQPRPRFIALDALASRLNIAIDEQVIKEGRVLVDGRPVFNSASRVRTDATVKVLPAARLRGDVKLSYALDHFGVQVAGRVAADVGASAGGFTTALISRGARRVYAIDAGVGQLLGRLRMDERVVNLEGHNLGMIDRRHVPDHIELITVDLSYLAIADALPQLEAIDITPDAELVALIKPTFELRRRHPPTGRAELIAAVAAASDALSESIWRVTGSCESPVRGAGGTVEFFIHGERDERS